MTNFSCLWIGRDLSKIEVLSLSSYLYCGHKVDLYVYDDIKNIPLGVNVLDANEIIDKSQIFKYDNSYAKFSDIFRYTIMKKTKTFWTDIDSVCLKKDWNFNKRYVFCVNNRHNIKEYVSGGVFKIEDDKVIDYLLSRCEKEKYVDTWSSCGPSLLTEAVFKFNLQKYILPEKAFVPIVHTDWQILWDPNKYNDFLNITKNSYAVHIFNSEVNRNEVSKDIFPKKSALDILYNKYVVNKL